MGIFLSCDGWRAPPDSRILGGAKKSTAPPSPIVPRIGRLTCRVLSRKRFGAKKATVPPSSIVQRAGSLKFKRVPFWAGQSRAYPIPVTYYSSSKFEAGNPRRSTENIFSVFFLYTSRFTHKTPNFVSHECRTQ